jgi:hypothetical protein
MEVVGSQRATSDEEAGGMEVERVRSEKPTEDSPLWSFETLSHVMTGALALGGCGICTLCDRGCKCLEMIEMIE